MKPEANKGKRKQRGMTFKILVIVPFCVALIIQGVLCVGVLNGTKTLSQMEANSYKLFSEQVSSRAGYLEGDMIFRWSVLDPVSAKMSEDMSAVLTAQGATPTSVLAGSELSVSLIDTIADDLISFTHHAQVNGAYVILASDTESNPGQHPALYVRDSNPAVDVANGSDLMLAACPLSVSRRLNLALDSRWSPTFELAQEGDARSDFYYRALRVAEQYPEAHTSDLGFWGSPVDLGWAGAESITYTKPLKDTSGAVLGVVGVEISLDRIATYFPYGELGSGGDGSYVLAIADPSSESLAHTPAASESGQARTYRALATTGALQSLYLENNSFEASMNDDGRMTVQPLSGSSSSQAIVTSTELILYDTTSPFASEQWVLLGLQREKDLFSASQSLAGNLTQVFVLSVVFGLIIAVVTAWASSSRLRHLMKEVRATQPEQPISFTPTGMVEVDELAEAIETLGSEVAVSASRLSQTLKLSNRSIAAFECNPQTGLTTYTEGFYETLGLVRDMEEVDSIQKSGGVVPHEVFERLFEVFAQTSEEEGPHQWIICDTQSRHFVRIVITEGEDEGRLFGLVEDATDEIVTRRRIEHERDHDVLTGLLNRRAFEQDVTERLAKTPPPFAAMVMLDLDNLKYINDTYGHDWGDHYIKAAAKVIDLSFDRQGVYARISGDEFLVFVDGCSGYEETKTLLDSFMKALDTSVLKAPDKTVLKVRASVGVAYYPQDAIDFNHLREYADFAMYEAKNSRKGELVQFDQKSHAEGAFILSGKEDLNRLLDENLLDFHFQPIVDVRGARIMAYEALMRPRLASIATPDRVLMLARSQSKLHRVEYLTFFGALAAFSQYDFTDERVLFVNSIASQRLSSKDEAELQRLYTPLLGRLVVEITESDYNPEMSVYKEQLVRKWGARLAVDDFGSGYNSEATLLEFHADFVKIDMGIVRNIDHVKDRQDIAKNLIKYAHDRGIGVVAEGVETELELRALCEIGIDYVQGYLLGKPAPVPQELTMEAKEILCRCVV